MPHKLVEVSKDRGSAAFIRRRRSKREEIIEQQRPLHENVVVSNTLPLLPYLIPSNNKIDPKKAIGPSAIRKILCNERCLFVTLIGFRLLNASLLQTSFVPDEFWQSLEVAHRWVFGYGYLTWEWTVAVRSPIYPLLFTLPYQIINWLSYFLSPSIQRALIIRIPRLIQALFTAWGDFSLYQFSRRVAGQDVAQWTLFLNITNWFVLYASCRTLLNSLEATFISVALAYFPWPSSPPSDSTISPTIQHHLTPQFQSHLPFMIICAFGVLIRPTSVLILAPICLLHLICVYCHSPKLARQWIIRYFIVGLFSIFLSVIIDRLAFGDWTVNQWNFVRFNILNDSAVMYGKHVWHWYVTQGVPILLFTQLPLFVITLITACLGIPLVVETVESMNTLFIIRFLLGICAVNIYILSFLAHKEFRFLFGIMPLMMFCCGCALSWLFGQQQQRRRCKQYLQHGIVIILLISQIFLALYTSLIHQRGPLDTMAELSRSLDKMNSLNVPSSSSSSSDVLFLTPCHAFPFYSHVHRNVSMRFLTCEPNFAGVTNYVDEADQFFANPINWLNKEWNGTGGGGQTKLPAFVIMFHTLHDKVAELFHHRQYKIQRKIFHSHFTDGQYSRYVLFFCRSDVCA